tara:strand:- start:505 stop:711 length:207 start_codon:yes stop_codon:yes gene_type:complete
MPWINQMPKPERELQVPLYIPLPPPNWCPERRDSPDGLVDIVSIIDPPHKDDEEKNRGVIIIDLYDSN